jgi:hypothetical protein
VFLKVASWKNIMWFVIKKKTSAEIHMTF